MDIQASWERALKETEIVRPRVQPLSVSASTELPYIFLAESSVNHGDTVVRKGQVVVEKPALVLPPFSPQFGGFEESWNADTLINFLFVRGVKFPSLRYENRIDALEVYEGRLKRAAEHFRAGLEAGENVTTGLVVGPEDLWSFSILLFIAGQVMRQAEGDILKLFERNP